MLMCLGNNSSPNTFSNNLLNNLGQLTGTKPHIRVGGNTQDYALYNASLKTAINGTFNLARSSLALHILNHTARGQTPNSAMASIWGLEETTPQVGKH
jgi:hypothetical protein